jgi:hypothetical protein
LLPVVQWEPEETRMVRPKKSDDDRVRKVSVSMTPEVWGQLRALAHDDRGRELAGGVSGVIRSILVPYLARLGRHQAKQREAAA